MTKRLANEQTVAKLLGLSERTLQRRRWAGGGPPFIKVGRLVRYDLDELEAWLDSHRRTSTSSSEATPKS